MTTVFLYGLGFICLLVVGALFLDAYLAKRQIRQWFEWKQIDVEDSELSEPGNNLPKRRKKFIAGIAAVMAFSVLLMVVFKRHVSATSRVATINPDMQIQTVDMKTVTFDTGDLTAKVTGCYSINAIIENQAGFNDLQIPELMLGLEWMPDFDGNFMAASDLDLDFDLPDIELGCNVNTPGSEWEMLESSVVNSVDEPDGAFSPDLDPQQPFSSQILMQ